MKTDNRVGQLKAEYDVQLTFEGDNNVLMQQVKLAKKFFVSLFQCALLIARSLMFGCENLR